MVKSKNMWHFRKEISLGTVIHVLVLLGMVLATWSNLQKELLMIRQELAQLKECGKNYSKDLKELYGNAQDQEIRLRLLENDLCFKERHSLEGDR